MTDHAALRVLDHQGALPDRADGFVFAVHWTDPRFKGSVYPVAWDALCARTRGKVVDAVREQYGIVIEPGDVALTEATAEEVREAWRKRLPIDPMAPEPLPAAVLIAHWTPPARTVEGDAPAGDRCPECGHQHTPEGCTGDPTPSDRWAGVTPAACDCPRPMPPRAPRDRAPRNYAEQRALLDASLRDIQPAAGTP